ncbi:MAG: VWA domain-containing protein, partial [Gammaproteobacteria bacterium]|nr:VWA domain-containing protein [Gammaproteobacteria bacterium]
PLLIRWLGKPATAQQAALKVPFIDDFSDPAHQQGLTQAGHMLLLFVAALAWLALVGATARPMWYGDPVELPVKGRDIMLAVDLSGSMQQEDFVLDNQRVDRLTATKVVAGEFIKQRTGDRVGLILFGTQAYLQTPLTFDRQTVVTLLYEALINIAGEKTAIGDAIGLAIKRLRDKAGDSILILLTDGENTAGQISPLKAAQLAAQENLKIYTIGIGPDKRSGNSFFGMLRGTRSGIDEKTLALIAKETGGRYFHASNTQELDEVYKLIDSMEPIESDARTYRPRQALFFWPLGGGLILSGLVLLSLLTGRGRS